MSKTISLTEATEFINATNKDNITELTNPCFTGTLALQEKGEGFDGVLIIRENNTEKYFKLKMEKSLLEQI